MWQRSWLATLLLVAGGSHPAFSQTKLAWKLAEGDRFHLESVVTTVLSRTFLEKPIEDQILSTTLDSFRVVKNDGKEIVLEKTIASITVKNGFTGAAHSSERFVKKMQGAVCTITLDPLHQKVVKVEGIDEHVRKEFAENPVLRQTVAADFSDNSVKDDMSYLFTACLPDRAVVPGATWERKTNLPMGPMGAFSADGHYTYRGKSAEKPNLDQIDAAWTLAYLPPRKDSGLPYDITKGEFKTVGAKGTYLFDAAAGRLAQSDRELKFKGILQVTAMNTELRMQLDQRQTWKFKLLDMVPASK